MKKGQKVMDNCKAANKICEDCNWLAQNETCFATACFLAGKHPGFYQGKHENCFGCGDCLVSDSYLVAVNKEYIGAEMPSSPEQKGNSDSWNDVNGDLVVGEFEAENEKQAIAAASEQMQCPETMLKAWRIGRKTELTPEEENLIVALRAAEIEPEKALGNLHQYYDEWADDMAEDPEPLYREEDLRKKAENLIRFLKEGEA